jgi:hypothetical protein
MQKIESVIDEAHAASPSLAAWVREKLGNPSSSPTPQSSPEACDHSSAPPRPTILRAADAFE